MNSLSYCIYPFIFLCLSIWNVFIYILGLFQKNKRKYISFIIAMLIYIPHYCIFLLSSCLWNSTVGIVIICVFIFSHSLFCTFSNIQKRRSASIRVHSVTWLPQVLTSAALSFSVSVVFEPSECTLQTAWLFTPEQTAPVFPKSQEILSLIFENFENCLSLKTFIAEKKEGMNDFEMVRGNAAEPKSRSWPTATVAERTSEASPVQQSERFHPRFKGHNTFSQPCLCKIHLTLVCSIKGHKLFSQMAKGWCWKRVLFLKSGVCSRRNPSDPSSSSPVRRHQASPLSAAGRNLFWPWRKTGPMKERILTRLLSRPFCLSRDCLPLSSEMILAS